MLVALLPFLVVGQDRKRCIFSYSALIDATEFFALPSQLILSRHCVRSPVATGWINLRSALPQGGPLMKQTVLNRAVAQATGETVDRIQRIGFSLLVLPQPAVPPPLMRRRRRRRAKPPVKIPA